MNDVFIVIGAGGHAKVVVSTLLAAGHKVDALYDDDPAKEGTNVLGVPVRRGIDNAPQGARAVLGIGREETRRRLAERLDLDWRHVVHPRAVVDPSARINPGSVVFAGAVVQPDVQIGAHAIINTGATVDHDSVVEDYAQLGPGVHTGGTVHIGEGAFIGTGATLLPGIRIGAWSVIGAGAVVTKDIPDSVVAQGVPAQTVKEISKVQT